MVRLSSTNRDAIQNLKNAFSILPSFKVTLFFPGLIAQFLRLSPEVIPDEYTDEHLEHLERFFQTVTEGMISGRAFDCLSAFYETDLFNALNLLNKSTLLHGNTGKIYIKAIAENLSPLKLAKCFAELHNNNMLTAEERLQLVPTLSTTYELEKITTIFTQLHKKNNLNLTRANKIIKCVDPDGLKQALDLLNAGFLIGPRRDANLDALLEQKYFNGINPLLVQLCGNGLLNGESAQDNLNKILFNSTLNQVWSLPQDHSDRHTFVLTLQQITGFTNLIKRFNELGLLSGVHAQNNFDLITMSKQAGTIANALTLLSEHGLLTEDRCQYYFERLLEQRVIKQALNALHVLVQFNRLTEETIDWVLQQEIQSVLIDDNYLKWGTIAPHNMTDRRFAQLQQLCLDFQDDPEKTRKRIDVFRELFSTHVMTAYTTHGILDKHYGDENLERLQRCPNPAALAEILDLLTQTGLLMTDESKQSLFDSLVERCDLKNIVKISWQLIYHQLLTADNFQWVLDPANLELLFQINATNHWSRIRTGLITQTHFNEIKQICQNNRQDPRLVEGQLILLCNRILRRMAPERRPEATAPSFNHEQSTHTASVHASVSESAKKLMQRYGEQIERPDALDTLFKQIDAWLLQQPDTSLESSPINAARRCFNNIKRIDYTFEDPGSGLSLKQLIALCWIAIHDDSLRIGSLDDALKNFIDALYECQRGYNLSNSGIDNNKSDSPICLGGTFNKPVEKLKGSHPDFELIILTKQGATYKFKALVRQEAIKYLKEKMISGTNGEFTQLLINVNLEGVGVIWDAIKLQVSRLHYDEFVSLYPDGENSAEYLALLNSGEYLSLGPLQLTPVRKTTESENTLPCSSSEPCSSNSFSFFSINTITDQHIENGEEIRNQSPSNP